MTRQEFFTVIIDNDCRVCDRDVPVHECDRCFGKIINAAEILWKEYCNVRDLLDR